MLSIVNKMNGVLDHFVDIILKAKVGNENLLLMVRWMRRHCPPETGFDIWVLVVRGRARYVSVTEAPHNIDFLGVNGEEIFYFFETWRPEWVSNPWSSTFQAGSFNHCTGAPARWAL